MIIKLQNINRELTLLIIKYKYCNNKILMILIIINKKIIIKGGDINDKLYTVNIRTNIIKCMMQKQNINVE